MDDELEGDPIEIDEVVRTRRAVIRPLDGKAYSGREELAGALPAPGGSSRRS